MTWLLRCLPQFCRSRQYLTFKSIHSTLIPHAYQSSSAFDNLDNHLHFKEILQKNLNHHDKLLQLFHGICHGSRAALAESITLVESLNQSKREVGQVLLQMILNRTDVHDTHLSSYIQQNISSELDTHKLTVRIGITGPPGAGKSTFVEQFGLFLTQKLDFNVAVLAIDPSSNRTGGSLLGDKTRMFQLSREPKAYVRPSPSKGELGGVARNTMEALLLCEGAGYDIVIVETVGVGQSEIAVADMTDMFILIIPPAGGDELQGLKRGVIENCDFVLVNKADGDLIPAARKIQTEYTSALKFIPRKYKHWRPRVRRISSLSGNDMSHVWDLMMDLFAYLLNSDILYTKRKTQQVLWMWNHIRSKIITEFKKDPLVNKQLPIMQSLIEESKVTPGLASDYLMKTFFSQIKRP